MNKVVANILYVIVATAFLIILIAAFIVGLSALFVLIFKPPQSILGPALIGAAIASLVASFFIYNRLVKLVMKKTKLEQFLGIQKQDSQK
jgi:hypothetical protein